jgi:murein DD-endopeptidase MepM/ murein hydrolase activator NlpD
VLAGAVAALSAGLGAASAGAVSAGGETATAPEPDATTAPLAEPLGEKTTTEEPAAADGPADATASGGGTTTPTTSSGIRLALADAVPQRYFFYNGHLSRFRYRFRGTNRRDIRILVVRRGSSTVIRAFRRDNVAPRVNHRVSWNGIGRSGNLARRGSYRYRVESLGGTPANTDNANGDDTFRFYTDKFPVRGPHSYGDGIGAGRGHQGQDVFADCGTRLVAARGGRVQYRAYHSAAGYYVVIDIRASGRDYAYMHLLRPAVAAKGERVHTGERIGNVGETGNAVGCHLHFEMWSSPGWYEGGSFMDPEPYLRTWDHYS